MAELPTPTLADYGFSALGPCSVKKQKTQKGAFRACRGPAVMGSVRRFSSLAGAKAAITNWWADPRSSLAVVFVHGGKFARAHPLGTYRPRLDSPALVYQPIVELAPQSAARWWT